jgi:hypothetical protein
MDGLTEVLDATHINGQARVVDIYSHLGIAMEAEFEGFLNHVRSLTSSSELDTKKDVIMDRIGAIEREKKVLNRRYIREKEKVKVIELTRESRRGS